MRGTNGGAAPRGLLQRGCDGGGRFAAFGVAGDPGSASPLVGRALAELGVSPPASVPVADLAGREYGDIVVFCDAGDT